MSRKYKFGDPAELHFVSFTVVYWIDVFTRIIYKDILVESLQYCIENKDLELYAWCIMTNHVHLIISSRNQSLSAILHDLKRYTAVALRKAIQTNEKESRKAWILWMLERAAQKNKHNDRFQFWQQDNHPVQLTDNKMLQQRLDYLHENPVEAGFVADAADYLYSSATDYMGEKGLLDVVVIGD